MSISSNLLNAAADVDAQMDKISNLIRRYAKDDPALGWDGVSNPSIDQAEKKINNALAYTDDVAADVRRIYE